MRAPLRRERGFGLIDSLIALAILAFGMLAMTKLQARAIAQGTESAARTVASQLADEQLSAALVDSAANYGCYTLPVASCGNEGAKARTENWQARVLAALPSASAAAAYNSTSKQLKVSITWTGKASTDTRTLEASTDVR